LSTLLRRGLAQLSKVSKLVPWRFSARSVSCSPAFEKIILARVSIAPADIAREVEQHGLQLWDKSTIPNNLILKAANFIDREPSLAAVCSTVVEHLHVMKAEVGFDVSHSEPRWRRRIFVSLPERSDEIGAVRLAESIIHEAMHLHLTDYEDTEPLVLEFDQKLKSPWKTELRSYQGVMHGLFVFACLSCYFKGALENFQGDDSTRRHCYQRIIDIAAEIDTIDVSELSSGLSARGRWLVKNWRQIGLDVGDLKT
jgi:HEXXH motif-containing protein